MELKRRMEEDIRRLEFELDRIGNYETLSNKEAQIQRNQMAQDNAKIKKQLDEYFE